MAFAVFVPDYEEIVSFDYGDGSNLIQEDYDNGYNAYLNYGQYRFDEDGCLKTACGDDTLSSFDSGMYLYNEDKVHSIEEIVQDFVDYVYDDVDVTFVWVHCGE